MSTGIIILNSARSGSSLLAGMLAKAGVFISDDILKPNAFNPNGFFEDNKIREFNTKSHNLCRVYDPTWNTAFSLPEGWLDSKEISHVVYNDLRDYISQTYATQDLFYIKEPSIIRLMPLYDKIFMELGITTKYIHLIRHPVEHMHDYKWAFPEVPEPSVLWNYVKYNIEAERFTRNKDQAGNSDNARYFITFNELYARDKMDILRDIGEYLNIELLKFKDKEKADIAKQNILEFFKPNIRRYLEPENSFNVPTALYNLFISQYAKELYQLCKNVMVPSESNNIVFYQRIDSINKKLESMENKCRMNNLGERTIQIY